MGEWVSIEDGLPSQGQDCLIRIPVSNYNNVESAKYKAGGVWVGAWCSNRGNNCTYKVSHWMPLPEPPKEESK